MHIGPVTVILPTLNEEKYIERTLFSLMAQTFTRYRLVVADSGSQDSTTEIAERLGADVLPSPKGKLSARDYATRQVHEGIIVSVDADTYYPPTWLSKTIASFNDKSVMAATGPRLYDMTGHWLQKIANRLIWRLYGSNSAFRYWAFEATGGFNLSINQQNSQAMVAEEEIYLKERLARLGKIVYRYDNPVVTSTRRFNLLDQAYHMERTQKSRF